MEELLSRWDVRIIVAVFLVLVCMFAYLHAHFWIQDYLAARARRQWIARFHGPPRPPRPPYTPPSVLEAMRRELEELARRDKQNKLAKASTIGRSKVEDTKATFGNVVDPGAGMHAPTSNHQLRLPQEKVLDAQRYPWHLPKEPRRQKAYMQAVVSLLVLVPALYVILATDAYEEAHRRWAFGAVGTILGYWLKK